MPIGNITQTMSTISPPPHRGVDVQTVFVTKQEDFQDHLAGTTIDELNTFKDQLNTRIGEINSTATTMNGYADTASAGASTATTKAGEASTSASEALTSRNQAETFKNNASASATKASQWADNNYNVEVETGKYSAKHWSTVAQNATSGKIDKVTSTDNAIVRFDGTSGNVQNSGVIIDDSGNIGTGTQTFNGFGGSGFKNYITNGDMRVDQRNSGTSVAITVAGIFPVDRFYGYASQAGKITAQQRTSAAVAMGNVQFDNCLQVVTVAGYSSLSATDQFTITQKIEGLNTGNLRFGRIAAKKVTLSFWVRSSVIGLHCVSFRNSAADRSYVATYTINAANTFEYKTITINGDTSGTWLYTNGIGLRVDFNLLSGSTYTTSTPNQWVSGSYASATGVVNDIATTGNEFIITGIQLEQGSVATPFENLSYALQYEQCRRYYRRYATQQNVNDLVYKMRTTPTESGTAPYTYSAEL